MVKETLLNEIKLYCKANNIVDVEALVNSMLERGFTIEKYGETPLNNITEKKKIMVTPKKNEYNINIVEEKVESVINNKNDFYGE